MRLAEDDTIITVGGEFVRLRPTLRAAFRLEQRHGGFDGVIRAVLDGSVSVIADVIVESSDCWPNVPAFLRALDNVPIKTSIEALGVPVLNHVLVLAGHDIAEADKAEQPGAKRLSFAEYHAMLFSIATGWLGWPPETAWNATAAEIMAARAGREEMIATVLKAIFGASDDDDATGEPPRPHSDDEVKTGRAKLKALAAGGGNRGV